MWYDQIAAAMMVITKERSVSVALMIQDNTEEGV